VAAQEKTAKLVVVGVLPELLQEDLMSRISAAAEVVSAKKLKESESSDEMISLRRDAS